MREPVVYFELAYELAKVHARNSSGRIHVIPLIVEDLSRVDPVFEALTKVWGGVLLNAEDDDLEGPVAITVDLVRRTAVLEVLGDPSLGERRIALSDGVVGSDGVADLTFAALGDPGERSPGQRTMLGLTKALLHSSLDQHDLAIITYNETLLDLDFKRLMWDLAVKQFEWMSSSQLKTLIFVSEGWVDVDRHCRTGRGFRFALQGGRLLRRYGESDLKAWAGSIVRATGPLVLFLGAGFSQSSNFPLGNSLRDSAIRRLLGLGLGRGIGSTELAQRFHDWVSEKDGWLTGSESRLSGQQYAESLSLEQVMRIERRQFPAEDVLPTLRDFTIHHDRVINAPGSAPRSLGALLPLLQRKVVLLTVNFDRLVETTAQVPLRIFSSPDEFVEAADYIGNYLGGRETDVPLLKLHGTIDVPQTCVISAEQTEVGPDAGKVAALRALLNERSRVDWFYVGASMRDKDLLQVQRDADFSRGSEEHWVSPYLVETVESYATDKQAYWRERENRGVGDRIVTETADAFFEALLSAAKEYAGDI
jgi:hypothetical protein